MHGASAKNVAACVFALASHKQKQQHAVYILYTRQKGVGNDWRILCSYTVCLLSVAYFAMRCLLCVLGIGVLFSFHRNHKIASSSRVDALLFFFVEYFLQTLIYVKLQIFHCILWTIRMLRSTFILKSCK